MRQHSQTRTEVLATMAATLRSRAPDARMRTASVFVLVLLVSSAGLFTLPPAVAAAKGAATAAGLEAGGLPSSSDGTSKYAEIHLAVTRGNIDIARIRAVTNH